MNVLVTGGSGFIGTHLVERLKKEGCGVQNLDIRNGAVCNVCYFPRIEFFMMHQDVVFHAANIPAHRLSIDDPREVILNNYQTTLNIVEAVRKSGRCNKIVFLSSFAVYGKNDNIPWTENTPVQATTPYGLCKIQCEELLRRYHEWYGIEVIIIRPSNVFGEHEELHQPIQVIPKWLDDFQEGRSLVVHGGDTFRDLTYVGDVVEGIVSASVKTGFRIYNLCSGKAIFLKDIAKYISDKVAIVNLSKHETEKWSGSYGKAMKELGWKPTKTIWEWIDERKREIKAEKDNVESGIGR